MIVPYHLLLMVPEKGDSVVKEGSSELAECIVDKAK